MSTTIEINKKSVREFLGSAKKKDLLFQNIKDPMLGLMKRYKIYLMTWLNIHKREWILLIS